jgi:hypothetical protein
MEVFKVKAGSWAYPEPAWTKFGGVPLFSGFMYASVASFLIQVWHRLDLRMERWPHRQAPHHPAGRHVCGARLLHRLVPAQHHQLPARRSVEAANYAY